MEQTACCAAFTAGCAALRWWWWCSGREHPPLLLPFGASSAWCRLLSMHGYSSHLGLWLSSVMDTPRGWMTAQGGECHTRVVMHGSLHFAVTVWLISEVTASQKQPVYVSSTTKSPESGQQVATDIDLLSILVVIAIFVICIVVCTVLGCRHKGSHGGHSEMTGSSAIGEEGVSLTGNACSPYWCFQSCYVCNFMSTVHAGKYSFKMVRLLRHLLSHVASVHSLNHHYTLPEAWDEHARYLFELMASVAEHQVRRCKRKLRGSIPGGKLALSTLLLSRFLKASPAAFLASIKTCIQLWHHKVWLLGNNVKAYVSRPLLEVPWCVQFHEWIYSKIYQCHLFHPVSFAGSDFCAIGIGNDFCDWYSVRTEPLDIGFPGRFMGSVLHPARLIYSPIIPREFDRGQIQKLPHLLSEHTYLLWHANSYCQQHLSCDSLENYLLFTFPLIF